MKEVPRSDRLGDGRLHQNAGVGEGAARHRRHHAVAQAGGGQAHERDAAAQDLARPAVQQLRCADRRHRPRRGAKSRPDNPRDRDRELRRRQRRRRERDGRQRHVPALLGRDEPAEDAVVVELEHPVRHRLRASQRRRRGEPARAAGVERRDQHRGDGAKRRGQAVVAGPGFEEEDVEHDTASAGAARRADEIGETRSRPGPRSLRGERGVVHDDGGDQRRRASRQRAHHRVTQR